MRAAVAFALTCVTASAVSGAARAAARSFTARVDRTQVALDETLIYEATLTLDDGRAQDFRPPSFDGFRVLGQQPSQSTQIQMGGGASFMQIVYSWRFELQPMKKGTLTIGAASVRIGGSEQRTNALTIRVGDAAGRASPPPPPASAGRGFMDPFFSPPTRRAPPAESTGPSFLRVVPSKTTVYVGEALRAEWFLYLSERQDKYQTTTEPRTDGFWSEDLPLPGNQRGLQLQQDTYEGRNYLVATLSRKALFPLRPGRLTIAPMEAEIAQVDFFGTTLRNERLKAEPVVIEALPLPAAGQPKGFDASHVGRFTISARLDKTKVATGEPVTLVIGITGEGNLRRLTPPRLPTIDGLKSYEPKVNVSFAPGEAIAGTKTVEYLLLPERAGTFTFPALELAFFDPATKSYVVERSTPLSLEVTGEAVAQTGTAGVDGTRVAAPATDNVLPTELRPVRARDSFRRDLGTTLYRSQLFAVVLVAPPLALALTAAVAGLRLRLSRETEGRRRRQTRRLVQSHLGAAEKHRLAGEAGAFFIEIERVLRELLTAKLRKPVGGLSRDELRAELERAGLGGTLADRIMAELEECDRARFAPGSVGQDAMSAALERAGELIETLEKARARRVEGAA